MILFHSLEVSFQFGAHDAVLRNFLNYFEF